MNKLKIIAGVTIALAYIYRETIGFLLMVGAIGGILGILFWGLTR